MDSLNGNAPALGPKSRWWFVHFLAVLLATPCLVSPHALVRWTAFVCFFVNVICFVREI